MFKSVTIEPRPNNERHPWWVKFREDDTTVAEQPFEDFRDALDAVREWMTEEVRHYYDNVDE